MLFAHRLFHAVRPQAAGFPAQINSRFINLDLGVDFIRDYLQRLGESP